MRFKMFTPKYGKIIKGFTSMVTNLEKYDKELQADIDKYAEMERLANENRLDALMEQGKTKRTVDKLRDLLGLEVV